jgi:hypothetical protein
VKKTKRLNVGGMAIPVGAYMPQSPSSAGPFDRTANTREVLDGMQQANNPVLRVKKGGYVKSADGIAKRGKTKGKLV